MSMEAKGYKISKQNNHIQVTSRGITDEEWQAVEDLLDADVQDFYSEIPAEILSTPCSLEDLEFLSVDAYHQSDTASALGLGDMTGLDKKFVEDNLILGCPDPYTWTLFVNKQLLAYKNQRAMAKTTSQNTGQPAVLHRSRQRGNSTRSSRKSGDSNADDPDPDDLLINDEMSADPRIIKYKGESTKSRFRCIRKAIFGCRIDVPTKSQRVAIDFYTNVFSTVISKFLSHKNFDVLTPEQKKDALQAVTAHILQKLAANHDFQKTPNPNLKNIFFRNFFGISDVLHCAGPGTMKYPDCPLAMIERHVPFAAPKLRLVPADPELERAEKITAQEALQAGHTFCPAIPSASFRQQRQDLAAEQHNSLKKKGVGARYVAFASPILSGEDFVDAIDTIADHSLRPDLLCEDAPDVDVEIRALNFGKEVLPLLHALSKDELRERLPAIILSLNACGISRAAIRSQLLTRAKDRFGKYPDHQKTQNVLNIFDTVPLQRQRSQKAGGAS